MPILSNILYYINLKLILLLRIDFLTKKEVYLVDSI